MIYNSLSRKKEELPQSDELKFFVCGPTVYDYSHIGHARTYIFFDFFAKYIRSLGRNIFYIQNITDIDDKIIKKAKEENKTAKEIADFFTEAYIQDMLSLGIEMTNDEKEAKEKNKILYAKATDFIKDIENQVKTLIEKGFAYKIENDGWYFDISKDKDYGKLSGRTAIQAEDALSRIDESVGKINKGDFCLWKFSKPDEPSWESFLGAGRPGWHIEDTAITEHFFGPQYDIHGGGLDLKFPHHEAEIAQQESASGKKPFVKIWIHIGQLIIDGKKMSKSLGNFITIRDFLKKYDSETLRWLVFLHHYRAPVDYSEKNINQIISGNKKIKLFLAKLDFLIKKNINEKENDKEIDEIIKNTEKEFNSALLDDLNTPLAISIIFKAITSFEKQKTKIWNISKSDAKKIKEYIEKKLELFGILIKPVEIPQKIQEMIEKQQQFRDNKQFMQSDSLRSEINDLGYEVEDTELGSFIYPKSFK
jgi:cysteinyl-tRNA synthetase